ncbi:1-aminocyclopropane-1-carboxylate deaminase/D-cysteine desulfhydrase [Aquimarina sp. 2201CG5-10]|uniref:1-aminocyclopropane-1-carboxylate deaminase/D-cysteine desulfhydrase n=1 Tax=Aquimarina callyspongiae TaxID=3098150 RepID=UPI002AB3E4E2|nr:pyridoxal-phosphate dependent enzyme [Aquimarina sp. 2201CG5-10]MDY8136431.1 pyridoxal-phosphate dependent enzyme [Aquimarina sp. 2201CG5-10]
MNIFSSETIYSENQEIHHPVLKNAHISLSIKREDLIHKEVSGNKFRKLKYNLREAKKLGYAKVLTFGGAFSNHIAATAAAGKMMGLDTIGIIRGEELARNIQHTLQENNTLHFANASGMKLEFITRAQYKDKTSPELLEALKEKFGDFYLIPEGGTNALAIQGCEEILSKDDSVYDIICCAIGTGGTIAGLINSSFQNQRVIGFPALKGDFLLKDITALTKNSNWEIISNYHFGGYGKINRELIEFINTFKKEQGIALDPIYTSKMIFGLFELIQNGFFTKNTRILAIHTGGLQGIPGMNKRLIKKNLPSITI